MAKRAFEMMMEGLDDAVAYAEGDTARGRVAAPIDVKRIRKATGKTQAEFAGSYHLPVGTLRDWEQGRSVPDAPARALLTIIARAPEQAEQLLAAG